MENEQEFEWLEAQKIEISVDLLTAAKQQLQFLAAVDRNRWLYEGPPLQRAIYRYNACWLPLLAKHSESQIFEGPLVVPLDCEWVWHCHRLNPVRYKSDCEELYGRVLDNSNVVSSIKDCCKQQTEDMWNRLYPEEPYNLDLAGVLSENISEKFSKLEKYTKYDLVSAVSRQSPFFYQVSGDHINNDIFLEEAVARYKGFLHLIKRNRERSIKRFCVPTYDIDLIWHTHQLHPAAYCKDLSKVIGKVLEHDDTDADRTKGKKLDVGFSGTTAQWEDTFGTRYWKAGAMYRGNAPSPVTSIPFSSDISRKELVATSDCQKVIQLPEVKVVEVLLEIVGVKNLPDGQKGNLYVLVSKSQPDVLFNAKKKLTILSESGHKQVASFHCQPTGELLFELMSCSLSNLPVTRAPKTMGTTIFSLKEFLFPVSKLSVEKWLELTPRTGNVTLKPIRLRVAISFTTPAQAPSVLHMVRSWPLSRGSCLFPFPGKARSAKSWTRVIDETQAEVISLQMRDSTKEKARENHIPRKQVIGMKESGETHTLAEFVGPFWSLLDSKWSFKHNKEYCENSHLFELVGSRMVKIFRGRKLDYVSKLFEKQRSEQDFVTAVEFAPEHPYGKAVALLDVKSGYVKVNEDWLVLPWIVLAFILRDILRKEGYNGFTANGKNVEIDSEVKRVSGFPEEGMQIDLPTTREAQVKSNVDVKMGNEVMNENTGSCSGGCGGKCGSGNENASSLSGGCGGACGGGGCGSLLKSGGCGAGCGSGCGGCGAGCGNMVKSSGCGGECSGACGGCGGGYGIVMKSSGCGECGGCCDDSNGKKTENSVESGGCGGECGGGCVDESAHTKSAADSCIDEYPKETPVYMNEAVAA